MSFPSLDAPFFHPQNPHRDPTRPPTDFFTNNEILQEPSDPIDDIFPPLSVLYPHPSPPFFPISFSYISDPETIHHSSTPFAGLFGFNHRRTSPDIRFGHSISDITIDWTSISLPFLGYSCSNNTLSLHPTLFTFIIQSLGLIASPTQVSRVTRYRSAGLPFARYLELEGTLRPATSHPPFNPPTLIGQPHTQSFEFSIQFNWSDDREQRELIRLVTLGEPWSALAPYTTVSDWNLLRISVVLPGSIGFDLISNIVMMLHSIYRVIS